MDQLQYYLKNLTEEINKERAKFAAETAKLKESVNLGVIRTDFQTLKYANHCFTVQENSWSRRKTGVSFNGRTFAFDSDKFLEELSAHIEAVLNLDAEAIAHNKAINEHNHSVTKQLGVLVSNCGFKNEYRYKVPTRSYKSKYESKFLNVASYLSDFFERAPTYDIAARKKELIDYANRYLADYNTENAKAENEKRAKALADPLLAEAIAYLGSKGKKVGIDFTAETARQEADSLAYELELERLKEDGGPFDFSGDDSCESCDGWDGESHRCSCGNRRVSWAQGYGHSFKNPYVVAEAH